MAWGSQSSAFSLHPGECPGEAAVDRGAPDSRLPQATLPVGAELAVAAGVGAPSCLFSIWQPQPSRNSSCGQEWPCHPLPATGQVETGLL